MYTSRAHLGDLFCITPEGARANNWKTFLALLKPIAHVGSPQSLFACAYFPATRCSSLFSPGDVAADNMPAAYKPAFTGIMADQHGVHGVWAVAMPLIAEFSVTREILKTGCAL